MKKKILLIVLLLFPFLLVWGQRADVREEVFANPQRSYGNDFPYPAETYRQTPSPKGYKPFYISHYGRHGSRYYWETSLYKRIDSLMTEAHTKGILTEAGETFYRQFSSILPELTARVTELTPLGYDQHVRVAKTMYDSFPEIFKKGGHVEAFSSLEGRCIVSMAAFCQSLAGLNSKLDIFQRASRETLGAVVPDSKDNPRQWTCDPEPFPVSGEPSVSTSPAARKQPFVNMFFKEGTLGEMEATGIQSTMSTFYTSLPSIGHEGMMGEPYSPDEIFSRWELSNAGAYRHYWSKRYIAVPIVEDILDRADAVISGRSSEIADLRFGHDSYLGPLNILLGLDGSLTVPADPDDFKYVYQNYNTCMAGNIQLIFYKSRKPGAEILVKALLCGREVTLPLPGDLYPYYRWSDFRKFYRNLCESARTLEDIH
ncbi:MAG: histidine-type phosphatase [Bacteroidales bacterium]|nr:histidine-type phosphatase [Bacteroidales bacterium]